MARGDRDDRIMRRGARLLWRSVRAQPGPFTLAVAGATLFAVMAVGGTIVLGRVTDEVLTPAFEEGGVERRAVAIGAAAIIGASLLRMVGVVFRRYFGQMAQRRMQVLWFEKVTDRYLSVPLQWFDSKPTGELLAHADADCERSTMAMQPLPFSLGVVVIIIVSMTQLAFVDPVLLAVALALFPGLAILNNRYTKRVEEPASAAQARVGDVSAVAHESFEGALLVKTLGLEEREVDRLSARAEALRTERLVVGRLRAGFEPGLDALPNLGTIALLWLGAWRLSIGAITTGELVQAMALFGILAFPFRIVGFLLEELPRAVVANDRVEGVLATPVRVQPASPVALAEGPIDVVLDEVYYAYDSEVVLDGVTARVSPGEVVALVGSTGAGKTTLCSLLVHLIDPTHGEVRLGGTPLDALDPEAVQRAVALVFQESFLFADTVRENLAMGDDVTDDEVWTALEVARARAFVERLPHGLDEVIGERGVTLSGGQRQRIALARALLRQPRVLLLDDATSAVDATVERAILDGLRGSVAATTLVVAHRVSTIALADRVLLLDGGRIAAEGTHRELLSVPAYAALVRAYEQDAGVTELADETVDDRLEAVVDTLTDTAPPGSHDHERRHLDATAEEDALRDAGAIDVLRRGLAVTPELKQGVLLTVLLAVATALGKLSVPILIQQILDRGVLGEAGYRPTFVAVACAGTALLTIGLYFVSRATFLRLVRTAEASLLGLRVRTFEHIHRLSLADHVDQRRGALVSRVTSDVETMAQFTEWGAVAWIVNSVLIVTTIGVMLIYSWQLALVSVAVFLPLLPALRYLQRRQLAAYDEVRTAVGGTLSEVSELVTGAPVVLAYGLQRRTRRRLDHAIRTQYRAQMSAAKWFAVMFPLADLFGALSLASVMAVGAINGPAWGLNLGEMIAFIFLVNLLLIPIAELSEILDQTQTAIAGWRKILGVLGTPIDVEEPADGRTLPSGPLAVDLDGVRFAYRTGDEVLRGIDLHLPAGAAVAVVGETGSGKTTIAKLLCRLADPTAGAVRLNGVDLREVAPMSRRHAVRMVPQDGFLFDTTLGDNIRAGRPEATDDDVRAAFATLGLSVWLDDLPGGLDAEVGERGSNLSVGERQLVALARAQLGDPGLLILDEATSSVDPETEQALTEALERLSAGRTVVSIAHRLSTAERADLVIVVDAGVVVERGSHADLVAAGGVYAGLYASWLGNTRVLDHDG